MAIAAFWVLDTMRCWLRLLAEDSLFVRSVGLILSQTMGQLGLRCVPKLGSSAASRIRRGMHPAGNFRQLPVHVLGPFVPPACNSGTASV
eukprot:3527683-Amphidinium_carterae.1